jgi:hypothetical protein
MTSPFTNSKPKKRDKSIDKLIKKMNLKISEAKYSKGIVRCRINMVDKTDIWKIDLDGSAFHLNSLSV